MPDGTGILFINKSVDSASLSRSSGLEKAQIFSHVQRPQQKRSPPTSKRTSTSLSIDPPPKVCCAQFTFPIRSLGGQIEISATKRAVARRRRIQKKAPPCREDGEVSTTTPKCLRVVNPMSNTLGDYWQFVFEFYKCSLLERVYTSRTFASISLKELMACTSYNAAVLNAVLCTTAGALSAQSNDPRHNYAAIQFKGQAIQGIKQHLQLAQRGVLPWASLYAVSLLLWIECVQGDLHAITTHINGLRPLMSQVEDMRLAPLGLQTTIFSTMNYCAAMLNSEPILKSTVLCRDEVGPATLHLLFTNDRADLAHMAEGFFSRHASTLLGPDLTSLIQRQHLCILFRELSLDRDLPSSEIDMPFFHTEKCAVDYDLLSFSYTLAATTDSIPSPEQDATRLALYIFSQPIISIMPPGVAFHRSMISQLQQLLKRTDLAGLWGTNVKLLLWVLFVAAHLSYGQKEWAWTAGCAARIVRALDLRSKEQMQAVLRRFYFFPRLFQGTLDLMWKDIETRRPCGSG